MQWKRKRWLLALPLAVLLSAVLLHQPAGADAVLSPRVYEYRFDGDLTGTDSGTALELLLFPGDRLRSQSELVTEQDGASTHWHQFLGFDLTGADAALYTGTQPQEQIAVDAWTTRNNSAAELTIVGSAPVVVASCGMKQYGPWSILSSGSVAERSSVHLLKLRLSPLSPYRLTYELDGGAWTGDRNPNPTSLAQERADRSVLLTDPVKTGSRFLGWRLDGGSAALELRDTRELVIRGLSDDDPETALTLLNQCRAALQQGVTLTALWEEERAEPPPSEEERPEPLPSDAQAAVLPENPFQCPTQLFRTWSREKDQRFSLGVRAEDGARLSFRSSNPGKVRVDSAGRVTIRKGFLGKVSLKLTAAATQRWRKTTRTVQLMVGPAPAKLTRAVGDKGSLRAQWKKIGSGKGYELQISTQKDFRTLKRRVKVKKNSTVTVTVKKLKRGTYYLRLRTLRGSACSAWSGVKRVKVQ